MKKIYGWSFIALMCACASTWAQGQSDSSPTNRKGTSAPAGAATLQSGTQAGAPSGTKPGTPSGTRAGTQSGTQSGTQIKTGVPSRTQTDTQAGAQSRAQSGTQSTTTYHSGSATHGTADQQIAAVLSYGAHKEVELAKLAKERAQAEEVKQFASKMITDHSQQMEKLRQEAGRLVASRGSDSGTPYVVRKETRQSKTDSGSSTNQDDRKEAGEARKEGRQPSKSTNDRDQRPEGQQVTRQDRSEERDIRTTGVSTGGHGLNWVDIHREIGERCLESAKKELSSKSGHEFDMCYMGMQVAAHMEMRDKLQVLKNYATSELQQNIQHDISTVEHHLADARRILDQIKDDGSSSSSERSTTTTGASTERSRTKSGIEDSSTKDSTSPRSNRSGTSNPRSSASGSTNPGATSSNRSSAPGK